MFSAIAASAQRARSRWIKGWAYWRAQDSGFTALEFAVVAMPFVMLIFGILSVCLFFFANFTLENAAWQASRAIRTGELQQGQGAYSGTSTNLDKQKAFKAALCAKAPPFLDCKNKAVVLVQSSTSFGGIVAPKCTSAGTIIDQKVAEANFNPGGSSSVVFITVCYPWDFGGHLPFLKLGNLSDGSLLIQTSVAFRTEPYS
jgi:Flp pilus assembly protein TadG